MQTNFPIRAFFWQVEIQKFVNVKIMNREKSKTLKEQDQEVFRFVILFMILMSVIGTIAYLSEQGIIILKW